MYSTEPLPADLWLRAQISADGRRWVDHGTPCVITAGELGGAVPVPAGFGGWLRLVWSHAPTPSEHADNTAEIDVYLTLKQ